MLFVGASDAAIKSLHVSRGRRQCSGQKQMHKILSESAERQEEHKLGDVIEELGELRCKG